MRLSYSASSLTVVSVQPNPGWQFVVVQASGPRVAVNFWRADRQLTFYASIEEGRPSTQVRNTLAVPTGTRLPIPDVTRIPTPTRTSGHEKETSPRGGDQ